MNHIRTDPLPLADRLRPVVLQLGRQLRKELTDLGVTAGQVSILAAVRDAPGIGPGELAAREGVSAPAMSGALDRLEALGLLRRVPAAGDRRRIGLEPTSRGKRLLQTVRSRRTAWLAERLAGLEPSEREAIAAAMGPLERLLEGRR